MNKLIDFYFDFISPYSYLAHRKIINLNQRKNFNYKGILLGGLHNLGNITAPAFNERKMKNMKNDCILIAEKNKIPFQWNEKFPINSLYLMRGFLFINKDKKAYAAYMQRKKSVESKNIELDQMKEDLNNVKGELGEIKGLLSTLVQKLNN